MTHHPALAPRAAGSRRLFIGTATTRYNPASGLPDRPELAAEVDRMADLFTRLGYETVPGFGIDLPAEQWRRQLRAILTDPARTETDTIVVYHTGHGVEDNDNLLLPMADTGADITDAIWAEDLTRRLLHASRVRRLLILLDTCHAALGGAAAAHGAHTLLHRLRLDTAPSIAILVAARPLEEAEAGAFTQAFAAAVDAHATAGHQPPFLALDGLTGVINANTPDHQHARLFVTTDGPADFLPNPRYQPAWADLDLWTQQRLAHRRQRSADYRDHVLPRARGLDTSHRDDLWLYTGRHQALRAVCTWLSDPAAPATLIVTGDPGSGKSALLARLFVLASKDLRSRVPQLDVLPADTRPALGVFTEFIHARGATPEGLLAALGHAADLDPDATTLTTVVAALNSRHTPVTVVIDAVDEALHDPNPDADSSFPVVDAVLGPLIRVATRRDKLRLLIGTRRHLVDRLGHGAQMIDLDDDAYADPASLRTYTGGCLTRLVDRSPYRTQPDALVTAVGDAVAEAAGRSFLVALITARSLALRPTPADPTDQAWRDSLPTIPADAMRSDLEARLNPADAAKARDLLLPLAFAQGEGLPWEDIWPALATALAGRPYTSDDLDWLITHAGFYVIEASSQDHSVYRLYHEALGEHLRIGRDTTADHATITSKLTAHTPVGSDGRPDWDHAHLYTRTHLATHAAQGGHIDRLLTDPRYLLAAVPASLHAALAAASTPAGRAGALAYRYAAPHLQRGETSTIRAAYLALAAAQVRATTLTSAFTEQNLHLAWHSDAIAWKPDPPHQVLRQHIGAVNAVAVGRVDGHDVIVSAGYDATVRVWDATTRTPVGGPLTGHTGEVYAVVVGRVHDLDVIVSAGHDATVGVWDAITRAPIGDPLTGHTGPVYALALGRVDGRDVIVSAGHDATVRIWDTALHTSVGDPLTGHTGWVTAVAMGQIDGHDVIASAGTDKTVRVWDAATGTPIGDPLTGHIGPVTAVAVGRVEGHDVIVSAGEDKTLRVWDATSGTSIGHPLIGHADWVTAIAVSRIDGRDVIISVGGDKMVRVWDATTHASVGDPLTGHEKPVRAVAVGRVDGRDVIVSAGGDATVRVWDAATRTPVGDPVAGHTGGVYAVAVGRVDGRDVIVSAGGDATVRVWDAATRGPVGNPLTGHTFFGVYAVAVGQVDGRDVIVSAGGDNKLRVWDATTYAPIGGPLTGHTGWVLAVAVGRVDNRDVIVSAGDDATVWVWDATTQTPIGQPLTGHTSTVRAVAMARVDGHDVIVSAGYDATVRVWDATTRTPIGDPLTGHTSGVRAVAIGRVNGRDVVVSTGFDATVRVWDATTRTPVGHPLTGHDGPVSAVAVGRVDGRDLIVSAGDDAKVWIRVWPHDLHADGWASAGPSDLAVDVGSPITALAISSSGVVIGAYAGVLRIRPAFDRR